MFMVDVHVVVVVGGCGWWWWWTVARLDTFDGQTDLIGRLDLFS